MGIPSGQYSIRIDAQDTAGNRLDLLLGTYTVTPLIITYFMGIKIQGIPRADLLFNGSSALITALRRAFNVITSVEIKRIVTAPRFYPRRG